MNLSDYLFYQDDWATIYCGDCLKVMPLMNPESVDLVLTDPFYVPKSNFSWENFNKFYWNFNKKWLIKTKNLLKKDFHLFISFSQLDMAHFEFLLKNLNFDIKSRIVWNYRNSCKGRSKNTQFGKTYEFIFHCSSGKQLNFPERWDDTMFDVQIIAIPQSNFKEGKFHQFQKPKELWNRLIAYGSLPGEIVFDPFLGSGTTCLVATNLNRKSIGIEIEPKYCEIAVKRLRQEVFNFGVK